MPLEEVTVTILPDGRMDTRNSSRYVGLSIKSLAMMRSQGEGPTFVRVGGRIFYFKDDLDAWISRVGRVKSTTQATKR